MNQKEQKIEELRKSHKLREEEQLEKLIYSVLIEKSGEMPRRSEVLKLMSVLVKGLEAQPSSLLEQKITQELLKTIVKTFLEQ